MLVLTFLTLLLLVRPGLWTYCGLIQQEKKAPKSSPPLVQGPARSLPMPAGTHPMIHASRAHVLSCPVLCAEVPPGNVPLLLAASHGQLDPWLRPRCPSLSPVYLGTYTHTCMDYTYYLLGMVPCCSPSRHPLRDHTRRRYLDGYFPGRELC